MEKKSSTFNAMSLKVCDDENIREDYQMSLLGSQF